MRGRADVIAPLRDASEIYLNAVVLGELLAGFARGAHRQSNWADLDRFLESPRVNLLEVDEETAQRYAVIHDGLQTAGSLIPTNDIWIAASAMQHGLPLLTLDAHFARIPQIVTVSLG